MALECDVNAGVRCQQSRLCPEPAPYGGERVAEGGLVLPVPGGRSSDERLLAVQVIRLERDERIEAKERRRRAGDRYNTQWLVEKNA